MADARSQSWQIGEARVTKIVEMEELWDPGRIVPDATPEWVLEHEWALGPFADPDTGRFRISIHSFAVEIGDEKIIVDTCSGNDKDRPGYPGSIDSRPTTSIGSPTRASHPRRSRP